MRTPSPPLPFSPQKRPRKKILRGAKTGENYTRLGEYLLNLYAMLSVYDLYFDLVRVLVIAIML